MSLSRPVHARPFRSFGRRARCVKVGVRASVFATDDLRLFALTFVGGFLFMTVYLG